jgi:SLOG cluster2
MNPISRSLAGCVVSLSISESEESAERGFPVWQVNRVTLQVVAALFGQGVGVIFGHDWREDGVMEAVHSFARQMQPPVPLSPQDAAAVGQPLLRNLLPWPDTPRLPSDDLERLASTLRVEAAGLPAELERYEGETLSKSPNDPLYRYLRARALTHLRHRLNAQCDARICIGGRTSGSAGRCPGVIEEALLALQSRKPLYLAGLLGGASRQVINAIEGRDMPRDFCPGSIRDLYADPPVRETDRATEQDRMTDRAVIWALCGEGSVTKLAEVNGLTPEENQELFHTPVLDRVIQLTLAGLARLTGH